MEFLTLVILTISVYLVWKKPEKEELAFKLFIAAAVLTIGMHTISTMTSILPSGNY